MNCTNTLQFIKIIRIKKGCSIWLIPGTVILCLIKYRGYSFCYHGNSSFSQEWTLKLMFWTNMKRWKGLNTYKSMSNEQTQSADWRYSHKLWNIIKWTSSWSLSTIYLNLSVNSLVTDKIRWLHTITMIQLFLDITSETASLNEQQLWNSPQRFYWYTEADVEMWYTAAS